MFPFFFIRSSRKNIKVNLADIIYIDANGNYVNIVTIKGAHLVAFTIRELVKILPAEQFCHVNRGCIVSISHMVSFDKDSVLLDNKMKFPFAENNRRAFERRMPFLVPEPGWLYN